MHGTRALVAILMQAAMMLSLAMSGRMICVADAAGMHARGGGAPAMVMPGPTPRMASNAGDTHAGSGAPRHGHGSRRSGGGCHHCTCPCPLGSCSAAGECGASGLRAIHASGVPALIPHAAAIPFVDESHSRLGTAPETPPPRA